MQKPTTPLKRLIHNAKTHFPCKTHLFPHKDTLLSMQKNPRLPCKDSFTMQRPILHAKTRLTLSTLFIYHTNSRVEKGKAMTQGKILPMYTHGTLTTLTLNTTHLPCKLPCKDHIHHAKTSSHKDNSHAKTTLCKETKNHANLCNSNKDHSSPCKPTARIFIPCKHLAHHASNMQTHVGPKPRHIPLVNSRLPHIQHANNTTLCKDKLCKDNIITMHTHG